MKKRNQKRILRIEPLFSPKPVEKWIQWFALRALVRIGCGLVCFAMNWSKIRNFHRHFIAVSDRVAGDCKVLIVLCICILFAMWIKKASLLFIYIHIYILRYVMTPILPNLLRCSSICILRYFSTLAKEII